MAIYAVIFSVGLLYILRLIAEGPAKGAQAPPPAGRAPGSALAAALDDPAPEAAP
jgi:cytochrome d ubiquinol oxidase subunit I